MRSPESDAGQRIFELECCNFAPVQLSPSEGHLIKPLGLHRFSTALEGGFRLLKILFGSLLLESCIVDAADDLYKSSFSQKNLHRNCIKSVHSFEQNRKVNSSLDKFNLCIKRRKTVAITD